MRKTLKLRCNEYTNDIWVQSKACFKSKKKFLNLKESNTECFYLKILRGKQNIISV